jgi:hypothetical protein
VDQFVRLPRDERQLYFVQAAERLRLSPQIVEKDFWVCWTLQALFALPGLGASLIFTGKRPRCCTRNIIARRTRQCHFASRATTTTWRD